jgi:hypothetical protein
MKLIRVARGLEVSDGLWASYSSSSPKLVRGPATSMTALIRMQYATRIDLRTRYFLQNEGRVQLELGWASRCIMLSSRSLQREAIVKRSVSEFVMLGQTDVRCQMMPTGSCRRQSVNHPSRGVKRVAVSIIRTTKPSQTHSQYRHVFVSCAFSRGEDSRSSREPFGA